MSLVTHDILIVCFSVLLNSSLIICADYVLEGSEGTPFEGLLHTYLNLCCLGGTIFWLLLSTGKAWGSGCDNGSLFMGLIFHLACFWWLLSIAGGVYHGKIKFPEEYPFKPPGIRFLSYLFFPYSYCFQTTTCELTLVRQEWSCFLTGCNFAMGWGQHDYSEWPFCNK
jgi:hypothetical protein